MTELKQTPLYPLHCRLGAKMTVFAGYEMPVQYPQGIIQEHLHCRSQAGLFDISHMGQCLVLGDGAAAALEMLTPGGIVDLAVDQQKYTVLTNANGGVIDDIIVTRTAAGVGIVVNAGGKDRVFAYLRQALPASCELLEQSSLALLALQGPKAAEIIARFAPDTVRLAFMQACTTTFAGIPCHISRSGYTGEDGFEISLQQADAEPLALLLLAQQGVAPIGLGARDTLRLEAGLCLYGHELSDAISLYEARLGWLVKPGHTGFPGSDCLLAQRQQGPSRLRAGLLVEGKVPVREGALVFQQDRPVGVVTSGSYAPSLGRPVAMALLDSAHAKPGSRLFAQVRQQLIEVSVCRLPFVPHCYQR